MEGQKKFQGEGDLNSQCGKVNETKLEFPDGWGSAKKPFVVGVWIFPRTQCFILLLGVNRVKHSKTLRKTFPG